MTESNVNDEEEKTAINTNENEQGNCKAEKIRIVCISDTHNGHYNKAFTNTLKSLYRSENDILIHAGDMTNRGRKGELSSINTWFGTLPYKKSNTLIISGNMDGFGLDVNEIDGKQLFSNATYLQHEAHQIGKLRVFGTPYTPKFVGGFQLKSSKDSERVFSNIPTDIDLLISHGPPAGILDKTSKGMRVGDAYLKQKVLQEIKPKVMVFGHVHESYGMTEENGIVFINAAQHNGIHLKNKSVTPIVFEFEV